MKNIILNKLSNLVIMLASSATVFACTFLFNEIDIPESLKDQHQFKK